MKEILKFLSNLSENNNRDWMTKNKKSYEQSKMEFEKIVQQIINDISQFDDQIENMEAKKCTFRLNRDVRFSKDKSPYKVNFGAAIQRGGKKSQFATYYLHIQPGDQSFLAAGLYMPMPDVLFNIRQEIDYQLDEFNKILTNKSLVNRFGGLKGDKLSRPPKGFEPSSSAVEHLKHKSFILVRDLKDKEVLDSNFLNSVISDFKLVMPFNHFLNRPLIEAD